MRKEDRKGFGGGPTWRASGAVDGDEGVDDGGGGDE